MCVAAGSFLTRDSWPSGFVQFHALQLCNTTGSSLWPPAWGGHPARRLWPLPAPADSLLAGEQVPLQSCCWFCSSPYGECPSWLCEGTKMWLLGSGKPPTPVLTDHGFPSFTVTRVHPVWPRVSLLRNTLLTWLLYTFFWSSLLVLPKTREHQPSCKCMGGAFIYLFIYHWIQ